MRTAIRRLGPTVAFVALAISGASSAGAQDADTCIAANDRAVSTRKAGKLIDARKALSTCASSSCPDPVRSSCQQRLPEANRAIPSIVFEVKDADGNDITAVKIGIDGQPLADRATGTALEVDPGEHDFTFEAAGHAVVHKKIVVVEAVKERHEVVALGKVEAVPPSTSKPAAPAAPAPAEAGGGSSQKTIGLVVAGVGVAGLALGGVFGLMASSSWSNAQKECGSASQCPQYGQAVNDQQSASSSAAVSTIAFVGGGVALAAGLVLFFTAPKSGNEAPQTATLSVAPAFGAGGGGLVFKGGF